MKYNKCISIIRKNDAKPLILESIKTLRELEMVETDEEMKKNIRNWVRIGEARLKPNQLSSVRILDESSIRDFLYDNPIKIEKGLDMICKELDLRVGRVDLFAKDKDGKFVLIEVKDGKAIGQAVGQLMSYLFAFEFYFGKKARGILIAPSFHSQAFGAFEFLKRAGIDNVELKYLNGKNVVFDKDKFKFTKLRKITTKQMEIWRQIRM